MLKKLASPKKRAAPSGAGAGSSDAPDAAGFGLTSTAKSPEKKKKEAKPKAPPKPKEKPKPKPPKEGKKDKAKKPEADLLGLGEVAATTAEAPSGEANAAVAAGEAKNPSPRKSLARAFRRKTPFEQDNAREEKSLTKKPLASTKKRLMKLPKPEKKPENTPKREDKKREAKAHDEAPDPSAEPAAAKEKDSLTPPQADAAAESPKRKTRWKIPDMKHHSNNSSKAANNQKELKEPTRDEESKAPLSPTSDNNADHEKSPSPRARDKKRMSDKRDKRQLSLDSSSGDSEQENQTNVLSPLRRHKADPDDTLPIPESPYRVQKRRSQLDAPPAYQPEVHLIGEIVSGHGFGTAGGLTCKWRVEYGSRWGHIAGDQFGQTQLDYPSTAPWTSDPDVAVWSHPIDLHFTTSAFQGWPKLLFQVWRADSSMKLHVVGYGFVPVPFAAGQHKLWVSLWRPLGTTKEEMDVQLLGRTPELKSDDVLFSAAWSERCRLRTISTGTVRVHIGVLLRHFQAGVIEA
ncbi:B9 domain-containing protein 2 [Phytophthora pseudosyringae]|uniref:B9 domain-containing protein 2 n=1 Tax=Phytophthora pseudosyringae TaxID=221518 RepID=A0A8T1VHI3_9STRA|nr:B9 domain-containing protein 2 [Phytophthora pseudosyringae]